MKYKIRRSQNGGGATATTKRLASSYHPFHRYKTLLRRSKTVFDILITNQNDLYLLKKYIFTCNFSLASVFSFLIITFLCRIQYSSKSSQRFRTHIIIRSILALPHADISNDTVPILYNFFFF